MPIETEMDRRGISITGMLSSVGGVCIAALLLWIASNQVDIGKSQAVLTRDFQASAKALELYSLAITTEQANQRKDLRKVWPRLRSHGENIVILAAEIEELCRMVKSEPTPPVCNIELTRPQEF